VPDLQCEERLLHLRAASAPSRSAWLRRPADETVWATPLEFSGCRRARVQIEIALIVGHGRSQSEKPHDVFGISAMVESDEMNVFTDDQATVMMT